MTHATFLIFLPVDPKWDLYRDDARFGALLARCGFADPAVPGSRDRSYVERWQA
jgi:hypothetical protein